jgi:hypothetical protein
MDSLTMLRVADSPVAFAELVLKTSVHALQAEFLMCRHPVRIVIGGRRAGKSTALGLLIVWLVVRHVLEGKPFKILICAPTLDQARILLGYVLKYVNESAIAGLVQHHTESPFPQIEFPGGVLIMVRSLAEHAKHVRGHGNFDLLVLDEAGFIAESAIEEVLAPLLADRAGSMILSSTPTIRGGLLHRWFERGRAGTDDRIRSFHLPSTANPFLDQAYVETMRRELPREIWATEWEGEWSDGQGAVFRWEDVLRCTEHQPVLAERPRYVAGFDPARLRDASALVVVDMSSTPRRIVRMEDLSGSDYPGQVRTVAGVLREFASCKVVTDATGPGVVVVDLLREAGVHVEGVTITASRKQELVAGLCAAIEKKDLAFPCDRRLLDELRWFRGSRTSSGVIRYEAATGARDDFIMATCLALSGGGGVVRPSASMLLPIIRSGDRISLGSDGQITVSRAPEFPDDAWEDLLTWTR